MSRIAGVHCPAAPYPAAVDAVGRMLRRYPGEASVHPVAFGAFGRMARLTDQRHGGAAIVDGLPIVLDGRIVNAEELRATLPPIAPGDAALIAWLFRRRGMAAALASLAGDFALAVLDPDKGALWLGRDRLGVKPLYWSRFSAGVAFASQPGPLLGLPGVASDLDSGFVARFAASHYRTFDNDRERSPYRAIGQVPAGAAVCFAADGSRQCATYWSLGDRGDIEQSEDALADAYRERLQRAVRRRMLPGARNVFTLSGGLDSSSVLSMAAQVSGERQHAVSCLYTDSTYDERAQIQDVVAAKVAQWHTVELGNAVDLAAIVARLVRLHDEPVATATWLSHLLLADHVAGLGFTTLLGGLGGDELNAGEYEYFPMHFADLRAAGNDAALGHEIACWARHHDHPIHRKDAAIAAAMMDRLADPAAPGRCLPDLRRMLRYRRVLRRDFFDLASFTPVMDAPFTSYLKNRALQDMLRETLPCCLRAQDRHGAALGVETLNPFLDHELVEFMFRVPGTLKIRDGVTKILLRRAMTGILPEATRTRVAKTGWNAPAHRWFSGQVIGDLKDRVRSAGFRDRGIYDPDAVMDVIDDHVRITTTDAPEENHMMFLWQLLNLECWIDALPDIRGGCA